MVDGRLTIRLPGRARILGFAPCCCVPARPSSRLACLLPPSGPGWLHEIKLDGFRLMARRDVAGVRLLTRNGLAWTQRYPGIAAAVGELRCRSCLLDGEVVICGEDGIPVFDRLRYGRQVRGKALLYAFDLLEFDGKDLRREPLEARKGALSKVLLGKARAGIQFNEHWAPTCQRMSSSATPASLASKAS